MARPMPVLPEVGSMIVPPGCSLPERSASSIIDSAIRSLIEAPGLDRSDLIQTSASPNRRLTLMCGVLPMVSQMLAAFMAFLLDRMKRIFAARRSGFGCRPGGSQTARFRLRFEPRNHRRRLDVRHVLAAGLGEYPGIGGDEAVGLAEAREGPGAQAG